MLEDVSGNKFFPSVFRIYCYPDTFYDIYDVYTLVCLEIVERRLRCHELFIIRNTIRVAHAATSLYLLISRD